MLQFGAPRAYRPAWPAEVTMYLTDKRRANRTNLAPQAVSRTAASLDRAAAMTRRANPKNSVYPVGAENFDALPGELALVRRADTGRRSAAGSASVFMTVQNGAGSASEGVLALMDQQTALGFVGNLARLNLDGFTEDTSHVPIDTSGQITVPNTGDEPIRAGDYVMWTLPASQEDFPSAYAPKGAPQGRIVPMLKPYRVADHALEAGRMSAMRQAAESGRSTQVVGLEHYRLLHQQVRFAMMVGAMYQALGSVDRVVDADPGMLRDMMAKYGAAAAAADSNVDHLAHMLLAPQADNAVVTGTAPPQQAFRKALLNYSTRLVRANLGLSRCVRDRIVGRAVTGAPPGLNFDIVINLQN